jgi:2-polyprenyl-3-methyl-5-hydroxy-6-metoxy-1,4-benzoquinol methylase
VARYALATRLARGRRVLDAACGEGYGSDMLSKAGAATVLGIDIDEPTVLHARSRYGLDVRVGDVADLPLGTGEIDLVVSFETIEHVREPERALDEFARVLGPDGLLLISTPNAAEYLEDNPFHKREFASDAFLAALGSRFRVVRPLYQQSFLTSAIFDEAGLRLADPAAQLSLEGRKVAAVDPGGELYTLALCGGGPLPDLEANVAGLAAIYEAHDLASLVRSWQERATTAERIQIEWEARATEAERLRSSWEERAATAERHQQAWQERSEESERQNLELRATIDRIAASLSWRVTRPLRSAKDRLR